MVYEYVGMALVHRTVVGTYPLHYERATYVFRESDHSLASRLSPLASTLPLWYRTLSLERESTETRAKSSVVHV